MGKINKPRIQAHVEHFRNLPEEQRPRAGPIEDGGGETHFTKLPYHPTELWLINAGADVYGILLEKTAFTEYENLLLSAFHAGQQKAPREGEIDLWKTLIRILRRRAGLPRTWDYLGTFAEDCALVADAIERETAPTTEVSEDDEIPYSPRQIADRVNLPFEAVRKRLERLRKHDFDCFIENENRKGNEPQYLYKWGAVRPTIEEMKESKTSRSRPG